MMSFLEYYELQEVLNINKQCNDINIVTDNGKNIVVDVGRDIQLEMTIMNSFNGAVVEFSFQHKNKGFAVLNNNQFGNIGKVFNAMYCVLKSKDIDPVIIAFTVANEPTDAMTPIDNNWYATALTFINSIGYQNTEVINKIENSVPCVFSDIKDITTFCINNEIPSATYGVITKASNFVVTNRRGIYYKEILQRNFSNMNVVYKNIGSYHQLVLNGSFIHSDDQ